MTATFDALANAFVTMATPTMMFHVVWATLLGIFVGALPGLTATMGVALMTTLTYSLDRDAAILVLICMYAGAIYGGSRSAILLNIRARRRAQQPRSMASRWQSRAKPVSPWVSPRSARPSARWSALPF